MTGFYKNMATEDYDDYRDTEEVTKREIAKKDPILKDQAQ